MPDDFLSRPQFNKPQRRPLGRVLLQWDGIDGAEGYEIQMSDADNFIIISKKWTVRGLNLEIPMGTGEKIWFRIRAFNGSATSEWSAALEINEVAL